MATSCDAPRRAVRSSFDAVAFTRRRMGSERVVVGTFTPAGAAYTTFTTSAFTVTAGAHTITFVGLDPDGKDNTAFIDQVQLLQ